MSNRFSQAENEYNKRNLTRAAMLYRQVIEAEPDNAEAYAGLAACQNGLQQYAQSIANSTKALDLRPGLSRAHMTLGYASLMQGQKETAEIEFQAALDSQSVTSYLGLADIYVYLHRLIDAETILLQALQIFPENANVYELLRNTYIQLGMYRKAIHAAHQAFTYAPSYRSYYYLVHAYLRNSFGFHMAVFSVSTLLFMVAEPPLAWGGLIAICYMLIGASGIFITELRSTARLALGALMVLVVFRLLVKGV